VAFVCFCQLNREGVSRATTPREAALMIGFLTAEDYDRLVDPKAMLGPGAAQS
jgi:fumarate hydratase class II